MSKSAQNSGDSDDLEALFDSIVSANTETPKPMAMPVETGQLAICSDVAIYTQIGHMTRTLHDTLRDLGYDKTLEKLADTIPDTKDRLSYIATLTEKAAERTLNATEVARPIQEKLGTGAASLSAQIQKDAWYKLWGNMTVNPISAMTGATTDLILGDELVRNFVSSVMLEAKEIGSKIGITIDQQPADRHAVTMKLGAFKTSMLQDVEAHRAVELDALVTVVKELGGLTGVPTPFTDALLGLSRLHAQVLGLYPSNTKAQA